MESMVDGQVLGADVVRREAFEGVEAYSGATFERIELADGRRLVVKHLPGDGDWITRFTDGLGRAQALWHAGLLDAVAPAVEHGVLDVVSYGDHDALVMADLAGRLWPAEEPISIDAAHDLLAGLGRLHDCGEQIVDSGRFAHLDLCSVGARFRIFSPQFLVTDDGPHPYPLREQLGDAFGDYIRTRWEVFADSVDADVAAAIVAVHADPEAFGRRMSERCDRPTVLHGDVKPDNLGVDHLPSGCRLVAIDWGELTGIGPREVDVARFAYEATELARLDVEPGSVITAYEATGRPLDPVNLDLACIVTTAMFGVVHASRARFAEDPAARQHHSAMLAWWERRVLDALGRGNAP